MLWWEKYIGKQYEFGNYGPEKYDCLTLILSLVKEQYGLEIRPKNVTAGWEEIDRQRYWREALQYGVITTNICDISQNDVAFFIFKGYPSHAGYMVDKSRFLHIFEDDMVRLDHINKHPWNHRFWGAVRIKSKPRFV